MYTNRKYPFKGMMKWTRRDIYKFIIIGAVPVYLFKGLGFYWLHLPWLPIGVVGTAVAFIVSFKNNASYDRLWEARKIYGGIVNGSRSWEPSKTDKADQEFLARLEIREFKYSLEEELEGYVSKEELKEILSKKNKQSACLKLQSKQLHKLKDAGLIEDFRHMEMQGMMTEFFTLQGKVERIKNFPYPRQFATLNYYFVWIFILLLPLGMMHEFEQIGHEVVSAIHEHMKVHTSPVHDVVEFVGKNFIWFTIPFTVIVSWIFHTMERIGENTENPFEGNGNDIPITTMSRGIEIDMRQMIDDDAELIPAPIETQFNIQL